MGQLELARTREASKDIYSALRRYGSFKFASGLETTYAGSGEDEGPHGSASQSFRRHGIRLLSTYLHRWNAFHIHEAAAELAEQLNTREEPVRDPAPS